MISSISAIEFSFVQNKNMLTMLFAEKIKFAKFPRKIKISKRKKIYIYKRKEKNLTNITRNLDNNKRYWNINRSRSSLDNTNPLSEDIYTKSFLVFHFTLRGEGSVFTRGKATLKS